MLPDKIIKKQFKETASREPEKYYATKVLDQEGFKRGQCETCGTYFWSTVKDQKVCGDASCQGGFNFLEDNPASIKLSYTQVWTAFVERFTKYDYTPISRFPVIARWNPTMDFTIASIAAFQPFVVSGEAKPPAKKLVIPQFCLRFGDVDNVGITMSHLTGFVMIGQHQFVAPEEWDQDKAFSEILAWLTDSLGLPKEEITFHEDAWAGGGNFGPCMEYFSRGVELGNQVYMMFEQDDESEKGFKDLNLKVLDMGMGMERNAWFSQGTPTIYDATFPYVIERLLDITKVEPDYDFIRRYMPHGAYLNLDEVEDIAQAWEDVAKKMSVSVETLRTKLEPMTAIYSIAEHARSLLLALSDGGLPSNVGGGYNLRVILRRALSFIEKFNWDIDLYDVCDWHANELSDLFPELEEALPDVKKILASEKQKFLDGRKRNKQLITQVLKKGIPIINDLIKFYDSQGITPEEFQKAAKELELKLDVPDNFYALVAEKHEASEAKTATKKANKLPVDESLPKTEVLYFNDWKIVEFEAKVIQVLNGTNETNKYLIFDKTAFYPTSGGQLHDLGIVSKIGGCNDGSCSSFPLIDCIKQTKYILHLVEGTKIKVGDVVKGEINMVRRKQLTQHHTATHLISGSAKAILGNHVWQAGASKTLEKGRLDITHYDALTDEQMRQIEDKANQMIKKDLSVTKKLLPRDEAEKLYGFRLYQGGAVPGQEIRVVAVDDFDIEACGGTHLNHTGEIEIIKLLKSTKVQDGIVRIEFTAGEAAKAQSGKIDDLLDEAGNLLDCANPLIPGRCEELFNKWKKAKKKKLPLEEFELVSKTVFEGDALVEAAKILKTQPEHVVKTIKKFLDQLNGFKDKL